MTMSFGFLLLLLVLIVLALIGLGMLGAGVFMLLQGVEGTRRSAGIILLFLGLLLTCALTVTGLAYFLLPMRIY